MGRKNSSYSDEITVLVISSRPFKGNDWSENQKEIMKRVGAHRNKKIVVKCYNPKISKKRELKTHAKKQPVLVAFDQCCSTEQILGYKKDLSKINQKLSFCALNPKDKISGVAEIKDFGTIPLFLTALDQN